MTTPLDVLRQTTVARAVIYLSSRKIGNLYVSCRLRLGHCYSTKLRPEKYGDARRDSYWDLIKTEPLKCSLSPSAKRDHAHTQRQKYSFSPSSTKQQQQQQQQQTATLTGGVAQLFQLFLKNLRLLHDRVALEHIPIRFGPRSTLLTGHDRRGAITRRVIGRRRRCVHLLGDPV
jgi:hypothetical protein